MIWFKKLFGRKEATPIPVPTVVFAGLSSADLDAANMELNQRVEASSFEDLIKGRQWPERILSHRPMTVQIYDGNLGTFIVLVKDEVKAHVLLMEIERLKRNKKKHSHLLAQLKALDVRIDQ